MKITPDTNILVRAAVNDEKHQSELARTTLASAGLVAIPLATFCEFVWVLRYTYRRPADEIADSIAQLIDDQNVETNRPAVEAGLSVLTFGGDFADGVIAYEGRRLGGDIFVTFDKKAAKVLSDLGGQVELLPSK